LGVCVTGCSIIPKIPKKVVSYKLEDLCNVEVKKRDITLNVYIESSEVLWDYHAYRGEIFGHVTEFLKQQEINCMVAYHDRGFQKFHSNNKFGVEIVSSNVEMKKRREQLLNGIGIKPEFEPRILYGKGYGLTRAGIALVNGGWEEFRDFIRDEEMTTQEAESQFKKGYKGLTKKDYMLKQHAYLIVHELLHCLSLPHPQVFDPPILMWEDFIPNIMENDNPEFEKQFIERFPLGYQMRELQRKLIHSFVAGKGNYIAFVDSGRDLDVYLQNIANANGLKLSK